ncbi:acyl-CoA dehydrogenase family protein [Rhodopila globiformis]|uniref:DNA alkylation response protein n=1 Tax=Rhodopila globiformis TaxID=1071 RepID=A0A2S6NJ12_RHOGL|nr:acyl-CoA dehydrogenase family protein [Rhodopila globiformis]PPQ34689.1 DNA alkylation response protein [Rhodopila globiformis]
MRPDHPRTGSDWIAPDCAGMDFYAVDPGLRDLLRLYLPASVLAHLTPHYQRLGQLAGGRLDTLAREADRHVPVLHARDRFGRDEDWIEYHPAYREMERIAFGDFQFHAMSHRGGVLGMDRPLPPVAKYAFQYLFVQAEFGLMCPISVTDTSIHLIRTFGSNALQDYLLPQMLSDDLSTLWKGTQFMTEKAGGSDVGAIETVARRQGDTWRVYGDKWFCSHTDADVALMLARPEGAPAGTGGLALFALPRRTRNGARNAYRIVRLKDKLGTKSMASGEIRLDGAEAYLVGQEDQGLKQMMQQVNLSRLSHGVRAAAMMRRCLNEALAAARGRIVFGRPVAEFPLMRRQLMKIVVPAEQALSMALCTADALGRGAREELRILTGLLKLRACRDNVAVATGSMEARGGNGYIEDWVNPRLIRDAQVGLLWEGTSNINALDVITRAVGRTGAQHALHTMLRHRLEAAAALPAPFRNALGTALDRAVALAERVAASGQETLARQAATALYDAASAVLLAWEGAQPDADARRALVARCVLAHRLSPADPLAPEEAAWERPIGDALLGTRPLTLHEAAALLA